MRVIAGTAGRRRLVTPGGTGTRPTTDRIKETLFNILQPELMDCVFIDLFAGSGGIGIEALSRGAKKAWFVEKDTRACSCIRQNLEATNLAGRAVLLKKDVFQALSGIEEKEADLIFMDPPYAAGLERKLLASLTAQPYVTEHTLLVMESLPDTDFSCAGELGCEVVRVKKYGSNQHVFLKKKNPDRHTV